MTVRKSDNLLRGDRTPAYVDRETGAAELLISTDTWDQWVKEGRLPPPCDTFPSGTPRWRWEDVDRKLSGGRRRRTPMRPIGGSETLARKRETGVTLPEGVEKTNRSQDERQGLHVLLLESRTRHRPRGRAHQTAECRQAAGGILGRSRASPKHRHRQLSARLHRRSHRALPRSDEFTRLSEGTQSNYEVPCVASRRTIPGAWWRSET